LSERPSIAVLPFDNMSGDPEQKFFADGISEDIITALSKVSRLRVVARNSSFAYKGQFPDIRKVADDLDVRYVLEGSVRSGGSRIRVTAQLVHAGDGTHLWAERYDRKVDDVFDIQDEIVKEIVTHLRVQLTDGETPLMLSRGTNSVDAWQYCVQASDLWLRRNASDHLVARKMAEQAIEIDPNYAAAWAILGWTYWEEGRLDLGGDSEKTFEEARDIAERAMALDESNPWAIGLNSHMASTSGQHDKGIDIARNGLDRLPGNADVRAYLSYALMHAGKYEEALENFRAAVALNPLTPNWILSGYSRALLCLGRFEESLKVTDRILADQPDSYQAWLHRAFIYQMTGQDKKSQESMAEVKRLAPNFRIRHIPRFFVHKDPVLLKKLMDTFRKIGLLE
jgi:adenylate cyclase